MSTGGNRSSLQRLTGGGYEAVFTPELDRKYMCPICLGAMRDAMQTPCGHRFCKICIEEVANGYGYDQIKCPVDNHWFQYEEELFADNAVRREILSLGVICNNQSNGCPWTGELRGLDCHLGNCDFAVIPCEHGCSETVLRSELSEHREICPHRPMTCGHCGKFVMYLELTRHEVLECAMFPVRCTLCGSWGIKRQDIQRHLDKDTGDCPQGVVSCGYKKYGCQYQDKRKNMVSHEKESASVHLEYVESKVSTQSQQITTLEKKVQDLSGMLEEKIFQYETILREVIADQNTNYSGFLYWKVQTVPEQSKYISNSFYTGYHGYKLHLSLEIGNTDLIYASLFVILERGAFDDELHFPFNATCDVSVIAHSPGTTDYHQAVECRNVPKCRSDGEASNSQRGLLRFMPVADLQNDANYCKDGIIFIEVRVRSNLDKKD